MRTFALLFGVLLPITVPAGACAGVGTSKSAEESAEESSTRTELGAVDWHRDFDRAKKKAAEKDKPMFVLFTEVPGCSTVKSYGREVLGEPKIAEAIEREFVPVAIFNNKGGEDRKILNKFNEPTWNNPAVRIVDSDLEPLAPRLYGDYEPEATLSTMVEALKNHSEKVPEYVKLLKKQYAAAGHTRRAMFAMYCFWSGEVKLGGIDGVIRTRPGHLAGSEVVEVTFDTRRLTLRQLLEKAEAIGAADVFMASSKSQRQKFAGAFGTIRMADYTEFHYAESDDNYQLQGTAYERLDLTPLQKTRVNSAVGSGNSPRPYLLPSQRVALSD